MQPKNPKDSFTVLRHTTGDPYYDIGRHMPSDRVREAEADWLTWRQDVRKAITAIDTSIEAAEKEIGRDHPEEQAEPVSSNPTGSPSTTAMRREAEAQTLIQLQREAIQVHKAHLAVAIEGQEQGMRQAKEERARADASQRTSRIAAYIAFASLLVGAAGILYAITSGN